MVVDFIVRTVIIKVIEIETLNFRETETRSDECTAVDSDCILSGRCSPVNLLFLRYLTLINGVYENN